MGTSQQKEQEAYAAFEKKVTRTVYLDNLSPKVTKAVLQTALEQFGTVVNVEFIPRYTTESRDASQCALVEMETSKQARAIVEEFQQFLFMISGSPRPIRARAAEPEMFGDRPVEPGKRIQCRWLDPNDPDFEVAKRLKHVTRKHAAEASFLRKLELDKVEKLAKQQSEKLNGNYKKLDLVDGVLSDGSFGKLARRYDVNIADD